MSFQLTTQEAQAIDLILKGLSTRARQSFTLDQLISRWEQFVAELSDHYPYSIYDYQNDLSIRDLLQEILEQAPPSIREKIIQRISPLDEQFRWLTYELNNPLLEETNPHYWWWYRFPQNPRNDLIDSIDPLPRKRYT